jgi:RNA polymerase sigma factor (TIGR02999 family)
VKDETVSGVYHLVMSDVTLILSQIEGGDFALTEKLLPLVYDELRRLAASKLAQEPSGKTLQPTALVHEAFVRLVDVDAQPKWETRGHFFAAAAEAMRRILVESARRKKRLKRGGDRQREMFDEAALAAPAEDERLLELDEALEQFQLAHPRAAELVKLRYFAGLTNEQAADALGISSATADRDWTYAKAWLLREISKN